jgi:hypothetical protein
MRDRFGKGSTPLQVVEQSFMKSRNGNGNTLLMMGCCSCFLGRMCVEVKRTDPCFAYDEGECRTGKSDRKRSTK